MKKSSIILGLALCASLLSCKKENESPARSKEEVLLLANGRSWKISGITILPGTLIDGEFGTDYYNSNESPCIKDDLIKFESGGVYTQDEGATRCPSSSSQFIKGTWSLMEYNTKLRTIVEGYEETSDIEFITPTEFRQVKKLEGEGTTYLIIYTYKAQ
jgi:hypothetical protein